MALPDTTPPPIGTTPTPTLSWAQRANNSNQPNQTVSTSDRKVIRTKVWRSSVFPRMVLFDVSSFTPTTMQVFEAVYEQYPKRLCIAMQREGGKTIYEVTFPVEDLESQKRAVEEGLFFKAANVVVHATPALGPKVDIHKVSLTRLPPLEHQLLVEGIRDSMVNYGHVLDIGVYYDTKYKTFLGAGHVILDVAPYKDSEGDEITFDDLKHNISWYNKDYIFHAVTSTLPKWCQYCHKDGHKRDTCPVRPNKQVCWICQETDHTKANCLQAAARNIKPHKESNPNVMDIDKEDLGHQANAQQEQEHQTCKAEEERLVLVKEQERLAQEQAAAAVVAVEGEEEELPSPGHDHTMAEQAKQVEERPQMETPATKRQKTKELFPRVTRSASSATTKPTTHIPGVQAKPASTLAIPSAGTTPATTLTS